MAGKVKMLKLMYKRKEANLTQAMLAEKVGLKPMTIYHYEAGVRKPTAEKLKEIAEVLGCSIADLI
jgi:transcriptional regulator with XRE-family HTH domain